jgi:opine dehydrogenase
MSDSKIVAIIGGGHGAFAAAAHMTTKGLLVNICDPYNDGESLKDIKQDKKLEYTGVIGEGTVTLNKVTTSVAEAVEGSSMVLVCVPTSTHGAAAKWLAPVLKDGMTVLLDPGHTGGALHFRHALTQEGFKGDIFLGETNTLTYITRKESSKKTWIGNIAKNVYVSCLPSKNLNQFVSNISICFPELVPAKTVIGTSLRNLNATMHPPGMILAAVWVEKGGDFYFYHDAATPAVGNLLHAIDEERIAIAKAWGEPVEPLIDLLAMIGSTTEEARASGSLQRAFFDSVPNRYVKAPPTLDHRYMHEDFGYGVVPILELGKIVGVNAPVFESLLTVACTINKIDYRTQGLTRERMGLAGKDFKAIKEYITKG